MIKGMLPPTLPIHPINDLLRQIVRRNLILRANQLWEIIRHISTAQFSQHLLEVDEPLWGGFWHFDVIAPGSRLPAVELALLRGIRLDKDWPEGTITDQFWGDLQAALVQPQTGVWGLTVAGEPCLVFAAETAPAMVTVGWYCATTGQLHAGYRIPPASFYLPEAVMLRPPAFSSETTFAVTAPPAWLSKVVQQKNETPLQDLAERLDVAILQFRLRPTDRLVSVSLDTDGSL